jgi:hypothetical protein
MILVDTSVWVDHFRRASRDLAALLQDDRVLVHPFVIGELALSGLTQRKEILELLQALPEATVAQHQEAMRLVQQRRFDGRGIGWIDTHLVASALLSSARLWTKDKHLRAVAQENQIAFR